MNETKGTITAHDGAYAFVRIADTGCGKCHEPGGCGGVNIGKMLCSEPQVFRVLNPRQSNVGQFVSIVIPEGAVRKGAFLAYGLPLLMLLVGAFAGAGFAGDPGAIVGALGGLAVAFPVVRFVQSGSAASTEFQPYVDPEVPGK